MRTMIFLLGIAITLGMAATATPPPANPEVSITGLTLSSIGREKSGVDMTLQNVLLLKLDTLYKGRLTANPALKGEMKIKLSINGDGSVSDVKVLEDTTSSKEFPTQVLNIIKTLSFEPATQDVKATFTITFDNGVETPANDSAAGGAGK
jgi:TonB family protein